MPTPDALLAPAVGTPFPELSVAASDGAFVSLRTILPADRAAVVFFMRTSSCPVCRAHIRALQRMAEAGELGDAHVVIVVPGAPADARAVQRITTLQTVASADAHGAVGLGRFLTLQHSGTFVLDPAQCVLARRTSALPTASFSRAEVRAALA